MLFMCAKKEKEGGEDGRTIETVSSEHKFLSKRKYEEKWKGQGGSDTTGRLVGRHLDT